MGMTDLTNALIAQAADDYFNLLAGFIPPRSDCNVTEIEEFFRSDLYGLMTKVDCEYLMQKNKGGSSKNGAGIYRIEGER